MPPLPSKSQTAFGLKLESRLWILQGLAYTFELLQMHLEPIILQTRNKLHWIFEKM